MAFPVVIYGCESWTVKKAECGRIDAFELWCWRRLLRVPWTARRSNQSILKEISPGISLEGMSILSIVAGIGGVAIAGVIQRSREDGRVADVQMLYEAATLAEASDSFISKGGGGKVGDAVTAKKLNAAGYATSVSFLKNKDNADTSDKATFVLVVTSGANKLQLSIAKDSFLAGSKPNIEMKD